MAVIIKPQFNTAQIKKIIEDAKQQKRNAIVSLLMFVGENFIKARNNDTYKDHTGNLRSSIGYVIFYNGQVINSVFPGEHPEGVNKGKELAQNIADDYPKGFVFVGVAGMEYALAVESKGYDVITNSSIEALQDLKQAMKGLKQKV